MCDCLNDVVEIAVCVQAGAIRDEEAPGQLQSVTSWARHDKVIDRAMAAAAPLHYAVALLNVPRNGPTATWLVTELERILAVEEECGLHPAWQAYGGLWLAHLAAAVALHSTDPASAASALGSGRRYVDAVGGICPDALHTPPTVAEVEEDPYSWLDCPEPRASIPTADVLASTLPGVSDTPSPAALVLGLRTINSDDWRTWATSPLVHDLYRPDPVG